MLLLVKNILLSVTVSIELRDESQARKKSRFGLPSKPSGSQFDLCHFIAMEVTWLGSQPEGREATKCHFLTTGKKLPCSECVFWSFLVRVLQVLVQRP